MGSRPSDQLPTAAPDATEAGAQRAEAVVLWRGGHLAHPIPSRGELVFGRGDDAAVVVPHASVSRRHARLVVDDARMTIEDLGSSNGTRLAGARLEPGRPTPLDSGAVIEMGSVTVVVRGAVRTARDHAPADAMEALFHLVDLVAPSSISVLIVGETGAGKEVVAERIHERSERAGKPLVRISCAAIPQTLLEGELFGHERGAFTGAQEAKPGLLETAQGGTLLFDEVGEIPLEVQAKLLRVIESRSFYPVGARQPRSLDVRFVSATHRDLEALIEREQFRQDLYYRLNGIRIEVPPLRRRVGEIRPLAAAFAARTAAELGRAAPDFAEDATEALMAHAWPGNVRELKNVIERAVVLARGGPIRRQHLMLEAAAAAPAPTGKQRALDRRALRGDLEAIERQRIVDALERCGGNQTRAAELLAISRRTLTNRLNAYGLARPRKGR